LNFKKSRKSIKKTLKTEVIIYRPIVL